jgi:hypothetical protein
LEEVMSQHDDATDARQQYEEMEQRRRALLSKRFPPARSTGYASVWSPVMTEQRRKEHEQQMADGIIPF